MSTVDIVVMTARQNEMHKALRPIAVLEYVPIDYYSVTNDCKDSP